MFPTVPMVAVTATATASVQQDIVRVLYMREPLLLRGSYNRYGVCGVDYMCDYIQINRY